MISLKVLSTAAAMALVMAMPTASFAQEHHGERSGGGVRSGGAPQARFNGGGGGNFRVGGGSPSVHVGGGGGWNGGWRGGGYRRGGGDGGFIPGAIAGAVIGGAIASQGYYGGPGYYAPGYYDDYDDGTVAVAPAPVGDDAVTYCMQTYRSYDPGSGTYLGFDGYRHPCP